MSGFYGEVEYDKWYDLHGHLNGHFDNKVKKLDGYKIKFYDDKETPFIVSGMRTDNVRPRYGCCPITISPHNSVKFSNTHLNEIF